MKQRGAENAQWKVGVREMSQSGSSSRLQASLNQADGPLRASTRDLFHSEEHWLCKSTYPKDQNGNPRLVGNLGQTQIQEDA
jgi:hypothetical protein